MSSSSPSPQVSHLLKGIKPSATIAVSTRAGELKRGGADIISLGAGEPDFDTPPFIVEAACRALTEGKTRYAPAAGIPELREAISAKLERDNHLTFPPESIAVTCGAKQAIYNALVASLNPGEEVVIPAPYWVSYPDMTLLAGGVPVVVETKSAENFTLTPESLSAALTERSRWLILNSPGNPTGALYSREDLQALGEVIARHPHLCIISDDIYEHLIYGSAQFVSIAEACPNLASRVLIINGMSKAFAMTGWRVGYAAGSRDLIKSMTVLQSQSASSVTTFCQWAAVEALNSDMSFLDPMRKAFDKRRVFLHEALNAIPGLSCRMPEGAFYVFVSCADLIGRSAPDGRRIDSDEALTLYALECAGVAFVHGAAFGASPYFRCSYATDDAALEQAVERLTRAFADLK